MGTVTPFLPELLTFLGICFSFIPWPLPRMFLPTALFFENNYSSLNTSLNVPASPCRHHSFLCPASEYCRAPCCYRPLPLCMGLPLQLGALGGHGYVCAFLNTQRYQRLPGPCHRLSPQGAGAGSELEQTIF